MKLFTRAFLLPLLVVFGCDIYQKDTLPVASQTILTTSGTPTLINASAYFNSALKPGASLHITKQPSHGSVDILNVANTGAVNGDHFYYRPNQASTKDDYFIAELNSSTGQTLARMKMSISSVTGCGLGEVVTHVKIPKNEVYTLNLLNNDVFCNNVWESAAVGITRAKEESGTAMFRLDGPNGAATLTFTPRQDATGANEYYYNLGLNWDYQNVNLPSDWGYHPELFEMYVSVKLVVEVIP